MDVHFIEIRYKVKEIKNIDKLLSIIPEEVCIVSTVQYLDIAKIVKDELERGGVKVRTKKSEKLKYEMQVVGCDVSAAECKVDTVIFVGDGEFHPKEIARRLGKKVIIYNPISGEIKELKRYNKNILQLLGILASSNNVGIVTSIKPGQFRAEEIKLVKKVLEKEGKRVYLFVGDNIMASEALNYKIDFWIIAACPRIYEDFIKNNIPALPIDILAEYCVHHRFREIPESEASKSANDKE